MNFFLKHGICFVLVCFTSKGYTTFAQDVLYDNGTWNGLGAYSIWSPPNPRRSLLDDFELPPGGGKVDKWSTWMIWDSLQGTGHATKVELTFYSDVNGRPNFNDQLAFVSTTNINETIEGSQAFDRDIIIMTAHFQEIDIPEGRIWVDMIWFAPSGDNSFMLTADLHFTECWTDYEDFPPPGPGNAIFGVDSDLSFALWGSRITCLDLTIDNLIAGEQATFTITGGTPNNKAITVYGLQQGSTVINNIAGYCATFEIQNINQNKIIGGINRTFDSNGEITFDLMIPNEAAGIEVFIQTAQKNTCPEECMSNLIEAVVE